MNFNTFSDYEVLIYVENGNSWMEFSSDDNHINIVSGFWDYDNDETEEEWMKKDIFFFGGDYDDEGMIAYNRE